MDSQTSCSGGICLLGYHKNIVEIIIRKNANKVFVTLLDRVMKIKSATKKVDEVHIAVMFTGSCVAF